MTDQDLATLEHAAQQATPGPWTHDPDPRDDGADQVLDAHGGTVVFKSTGMSWEEHQATARFIALANPQTVSALCRALRDAQAARWTCQSCGAQFPRIAGDSDVARCSSCVRAEQAEAALATARRERDESHTAVMVLHEQVMALERELAEVQARVEPFKVACRNLEAKLDEVEAERDRALKELAEARSQRFGEEDNLITPTAPTQE